MRDKIFKNIWLVSMASFFLALALSIGVIYGVFSNQNREKLKTEAESLISAIENGERDILKDASLFSQTRVTLVNRDGIVEFDSASAAVGENHGDRREIIDAFEKGLGQSSRYSETLSEKTENYAVRLKDGSVLRVSDSQISLFSVLAEMAYPFLLAIAAALVISFLLASKLSKNITRPVLEMNPNLPDSRFVYKEFKPFIEKIQNQNRQIHAQMEEMQASHEKQEAMRREFTANVSHELKTPLTSISGTAEIIKNNLVKPEDVPHFADNIYKEASRLIVLVEDIIKISQLEENRIPQSRENLDLLPAAESVKERLESAAASAGVKLSVSGESAVINGIPQVIDEIIYNLCDNSIKYNKCGGTVDIRISKESEKACLSVSDSGIGIPAEEISRIFERFYRVDKSHSKEIGGTGLGLAIVKHGALLHGAVPRVESTPGVGTTVYLEFDAVPQNTAGNN